MYPLVIGFELRKDPGKPGFLLFSRSQYLGTSVYGGSTYARIDATLKYMSLTFTD